MNLLKTLKLKNERGDTVVEVLLAMVILATVLGFAYASSSHSLQSSNEISNRNQAVSLAAGQIEYIKNAVAFSPSTLTNYTKDVPFCILSDGSVDTADADNPEKVCKYTSGSNPFGNFNVGLTYNSGTHTFTSKSKWAASDRNGDSELTLYYKIPSIFFTPAVNTQTAAPVGQTTATLNGTVNNINNGSSYYFNLATDAYFTDPANASAPYDPTKKTPDGNLGASFSTQSVTADVSGLTSGTQYHTQLCAKNIYGESCGNDITFTPVTAVGTPSLVISWPGASSSVIFTWSCTGSPTSAKARIAGWGNAQPADSEAYAAYRDLFGSSGVFNWGGPYLTGDTIAGTLFCTYGGTTVPDKHFFTIPAPPPPPPPPPPACSVDGSVHHSGGLVWFSGWGDCPNMVDTAAGPNSSFSDWSPTGYFPNGGYPDGTCHKQDGYNSSWVFQSSSGWKC